MKPTDIVLVTAIYHPKPGHETQFLSFWESKIKPLAIKYGANWACIYHNEETEEFLSSSHWNKKEDADKFFKEPSYQKAIKELNKLSLIPPSRAFCEYLREAA